jgi:hypothetical protein
VVFVGFAAHCKLSGGLSAVEFPQQCDIMCLMARADLSRAASEKSN